MIYSGDLVEVPVFNIYPIEELLCRIAKKVKIGVKLGNAEVKAEEAILCQYADHPSFVYMRFFNDPYTQAPGVACKVCQFNICVHSSTSKLYGFRWRSTDPRRLKSMQ